MSSAYDYYDYPSYWENREYEHKSEIYAIDSLLNKIPKINNLLEIGSGYGRLSKSYLHRASKVTLSDPSSKLLSLARRNINKHLIKKVNILHINVNNIKTKIKVNSQDVVLMVRVLHHIKDIDSAFSIISDVLGDRGYLILEFANKRHFKAMIKEFFKGNFTFPIDIFPKDLRSKKNIKKKTLPFINYHPDVIYKKLKDNGFEILEKRSVSNFRNSFFKKLFPLETLIKIEGFFQIPLSYLSFGPSIFLLCRKL